MGEEIRTVRTDQLVLGERIYDGEQEVYLTTPRRQGEWERG